MIKKKCVCMLISLMLLGSAVSLAACGENTDSSSDDQTKQEEVTEETVQAADPMTDEEMENDDADGCIEDSEDLLY